jgi:cytochrome c oxidase cbb3-type subunit 3
VRLEFIQNKAKNTRYHTKENGWDNHERYQIAFPFATGDLALDTLDADLTEQQLKGKRLFMSSCVTCHDRAKVDKKTELWQARAVSYPRNQYSHKNTSQKKQQSTNKSIDAESAASVYARHDAAPELTKLSAQEKQGEKLFQANCAFCHGADGTGKNWIGSFLQPSPRNLTNIAFMRTMTKTRLKQVIEQGLENTSMPAWKNVLSSSEIDEVIAYVFKAFPSKKVGKNGDKKNSKNRGK